MKNITITSLLMLIAVVCATGQAKIYWTDTGSNDIRRANTDGTSVEILVTGESTSRGLEVDDVTGQLFYADGAQEKIKKVDLNTLIVSDVVTGLGEPVDLSLDRDNGHIYFTDFQFGKITRVNYDGTNAQDILTGLPGPQYMALDLVNEKIYWADFANETINRSDIDGNKVETLICDVIAFIALDVCAFKIYYADRNSDLIRRANMDGTCEEVLTPGGDLPGDLTLDFQNGKIFYMDDDLDRILSYDLDGTNEQVLISGLVDVSSITTNILPPNPACVSAPPTACGPAPGDADGDGVTLCRGDCDDTDPNKYPGNMEICDDIDNDCDGVIDENEVPVIVTITLPLDPTPLGDAVIAGALYTDANDDDDHSATWNWGDGTVLEVAAEDEDIDQAANTITSEHVYSSPGVYTVTLTITDACGDQDSEVSTSYVVIYDPGEGFVTGGGWIQSPAGAYVGDPDLEGKANFGFVAKYLPGRNTPDGNTQFHFNAGGFKFKSTEYDWLVIPNHKAMYKGSGTVNNEGNFGFQLTAIDAALTPSTSVDLFRIRIWDKDNNDALVYDNKIGETDPNADPTTAIGGGNITIHKNGPGNNALVANPPSGNMISSTQLLAFPNPFRQKVQLSFKVSQESPIVIRIFNWQGVLVRAFDLSTVSEGTYQVEWDGRSEQGSLLPSGIYLARLDIGKESAFQRLLLIK